MTLTLKNLKFILIGDSYVGKTSVIYRFSQDYFDTIERPTVGKNSFIYYLDNVLNTFKIVYNLSSFRNKYNVYEKKQILNF